LAGSRAQEVLEDTGIVVGPATPRIVAVSTIPDRQQKSALLPEPAIEHEGAFVHHAEVSEVLINHEPVETALLMHTHMVTQLFAPSKI
jgi:hypothetical protein